MLIKHLTDDEVQLCVDDKKQCDIRIVEHVLLCEECKIKVEVYQLLITAIKKQPSPAFDFDISESVLEQLPSLTPKGSSEKLLVWALVFMGTTMIGGGLYFFQDALAHLFQGITAILIYLITITAVTVLIALFVDMYKRYNKEMELLDSY